MSYFSDAQISRIKAQARKDASPDDLWDFLHSLLMFAMSEDNSDLVSEMKYTGRPRDGAYRGLVMINEFAELIEIALNERDKVCSEREEDARKKSREAMG